MRHHNRLVVPPDNDTYHSLLKTRIVVCTKTDRKIRIPTKNIFFWWNEGANAKSLWSIEFLCACVNFLVCKFWTHKIITHFPCVFLSNRQSNYISHFLWVYAFFVVIFNTNTLIIHFRVRSLKNPHKNSTPSSSDCRVVLIIYHCWGFTVW